MDKYEEYLAKARDRAKAYYQRKKNDPEFKKKNLKKWRKWYKKKKASERSFFN